MINVVIDTGFRFLFGQRYYSLSFWFIVGKMAIKPITKAIKDREHTISDALAAAEKAKQDMQQLQSDNAKALLKTKKKSARNFKKQKK